MGHHSNGVNPNYGSSNPYSTDDSSGGQSDNVISELLMALINMLDNNNGGQPTGGSQPTGGGGQPTGGGGQPTGSGGQPGLDSYTGQSGGSPEQMLSQALSDLKTNPQEAFALISQALHDLAQSYPSAYGTGSASSSTNVSYM